MRKKLGLAVESVNGGMVLWKVQKRSTAGEAQSKGQSSATWTV